MNSSDDNPTVLLDVTPPAGATAQERSYYVEGNGIRGAVIPTSSFEPLSWVVQVESLLDALAHLSGTSVQRILRLATNEFTHLSRFLTANADSIGFAAIQKIPADLDARNRRLASPVSLDVTPVAGDIEDTATNAAAAATNAGTMIENLYGIFGVELMHAAQAVNLRQREQPDLALGRYTRPFLTAYRRVVSFLDRDRFLSPDVARSAAFLGVPPARTGGTAAAALHDAPRVHRSEAEALVEAVRVHRGEQEAQRAQARIVDDGLDEPGAEAAAAVRLRTKTSASQAKRARSVTTRPKPACSPPAAKRPKTSELSIPRSTTARSMPGDQYAVRRKRQITSRSRRATSVEMQ